MKCAFCWFSYMRACRNDDQVHDAFTIMNGVATCEIHWNAAENARPGDPRAFQAVALADRGRRVRGETSKP